MKIGIILSFVLLLLATSFMSFHSPELPAVVDLYASQLRDLDSTLTVFKQDLYENDSTKWKQDFIDCRYRYKMIEPIVAYYYPYTENRMNGPAVFEIEPSDFSEINYPTGFQVMEETLFGNDLEDKNAAILKQLNYLISYVHLLQQEYTHLNITSDIAFDICRTGLYAMISKGLSGFDSPEALYGIREATFTLNAVKLILERNKTINDDLKHNISLCLKELYRDSSNFNHFDRAKFISNDFSRLMKSLYQCQQYYKIPFANKRAAVKTNAESFLAANAFDAYFFANDTLPRANAAEIQLGKRLFNEPALSLGGRSCASCHKSEKAYTDGLPKNTSLQRDESIMRNTPTIINAALQPVLFYDVRAQSLEQQAHEVLQNKDEMNGSIEKAIAFFNMDKNYAAFFRQAFPNDASPVNQKNIIAAIVSFERSLIGMNSRFDQYMRGNATAMNALEIKGFNLFMSKAKCGTCHYMPLFNGVVPPFYRKEDTETIGVTANADQTHPVLDNDPGAYNYYHNNVKRHAFKTPTLRNVALTAPYMHNGAFVNLDQVIEFYNNGGAAGLGLKLDNQTLPAEHLHLDTNEKKALIAFLRTLNDTQAN